MKRVEVKLNLEAVAPLLDVIKDAADDLKPALAVAPQVPDHEEEFADGWRRELLHGQNSDIGIFLALFGLHRLLHRNARLGISKFFRT